MKPYRWTIMLLLLAMIFGCSDSLKPGNDGAQPPSTAQTETPAGTDSADPKEPSAIEPATEGADVIDMHGMVENRELLDAFIGQSEGSQRLIRYTIEGDPIYHDLTHKDGRVELRLDTTEDKFGQGQVRTYSCSKLNREETDTYISYILTGCDGESKNMELLHISFDVSKQDRFEFVLKYGPFGTHEINTVEQKLLKDLGNGQMVEVSDYSLPEQDRQKIYRELVLAGYLNEKNLSSTCSLQNGNSYDLKVFINGGERHFQWKSCDSGPDGKQMTAAANEMIRIVQAGTDPITN
ncbi:DUF4362 domain-containing protein [Paenibacillus sp. KQZ6P-2]|uniref:DUF4362 domain-containing protein n=1 Tax=Paenibacillus mangrovi TaxID=2931978 RepID=A0A9X2B5T2_9BACL|nr:DUF4362 domain-containing protein [Paenibacillus mangrovi]MCJ8013097.1 DUF4362 domain-containing protein [Paenibacillus mangrovi]